MLDRKAKRDLTIRSKAEAQALGLKNYWSGKPCKHGHVAPRATINGTCMECVSRRHENWRKSDESKKVMREASMRFRQSNPDYQRRRYAADPEKFNARNVDYQRRNPEPARKRRSQWKSKNPDAVTADAARRRAARLQATPRWLTEGHNAQIREFYTDAATRPGGPWHVDHIVPLLGKMVCGLHVPWNLQVLGAAENILKSNKLII